MYSPYGSYSSTSAPMEIGAGSYLSRPQHHFSDASCAFPSWPRRSSLSESERGEERATSFLSDEDLFPAHRRGDGLDRLLRSMNHRAKPYDKQWRFVRSTLRSILAVEERDRRRAAMKQRQRRGSGGSKKSSKNKGGAAMAPIAE
ncbi:hypothetical protein MAPG_00776 [Magnaporthiopsis poae ATCC 64411]|uniref:Uncharacterized protein n=1 Tax=Magnaporthiopsis poae (strain ATCC 64411 / 73-15) TaxID=644358 RepID=A0A0C4DLX6_MAGP6|nr:hypothetical protein MAPG_00776 [Magnaporthiopsis poae ATCC 64411]